MDPICPICRAAPPVPSTAPFCSERCKLIDLDRWLSGDYRVPGAPTTEGDPEIGRSEGP